MSRCMGETGWTAMAALLLAGSFAAAQTVVTNPAPAPPPTSGAAQGVLVDQMIAVVNDDLILESDIDEERRFEAFQPLRAIGGYSRAKTIERLVDRALILQQAKLQPDIAVSDVELDAQLAELRKDIPACKQQYHCDTDEGWTRFVQDQGFTVLELRDRWRQRMQILKFIEIRFKAGIRITPEEIKTYYTETLVPGYARQKATAPRLDLISDRISEILLQERVTSLLDDWLQTLKAQGAVRMMKPGEVPG